MMFGLVLVLNVLLKVGCIIVLLLSHFAVFITAGLLRYFMTISKTLWQS